MEVSKFYTLPQLPYGYRDLALYVSEEQLRVHHTVHHQAYVNDANAVLKKTGGARKEGADVDVKAALKELSWNVGGHVLHSIFGETWPRRAKAAAGPGGGWRTS